MKCNGDVESWRLSSPAQPNNDAASRFILHSVHCVQSAEMRFGAAKVYSRPGFGVATVGSTLSGEPEHAKPQTERGVPGGGRAAYPVVAVGTARPWEQYGHEPNSMPNERRVVGTAASHSDTQVA
jgi:hypothetical protein